MINLLGMVSQWEREVIAERTSESLQHLKRQGIKLEAFWFPAQLNKEARTILDALAKIANKDQAYYRGRQLVERLQEIIPRQMFDIAIQAAIGAHIIARQTVKALRKNASSFYHSTGRLKWIEKRVW